MVKPTQDRKWGLMAALALFALAFGLTLLRYRPPAPLPADAPLDEFSAGRAHELLGTLLGEGMPHPVGSVEDAQERERILAELKNLGYEPQVQDGFACSSFGWCANVKNILARLPGRETGPEVLLAAHYDSVGAGPGASDDGAGVAAVLEIARILKRGPAPRNSIMILIDEGEEAGLLGAIAFVNEHPWAKDVRAAVNLEARGTSGASLMFETGSANQWLMNLYAGSVKRPVTSSFYYTIYKQLPNDTDFTVFKGAGLQGFNFAFIGDEARYHTPLDDLAHLDSRSLQHHGDNALATVRALADTDLSHPPEGAAVFFDVFSLGTIWWPENRTVWFALAAGILVLLTIVQLMRNGALNFRALALGVACWLVAIVLSALLGTGMEKTLQASGAFSSHWIAHPLIAKAAFWGLGFFLAAVLAAATARWIGFWGLWCGNWIWWWVVAIATARYAAGLSYAFLVPAFAAGLCGLPTAFGDAESDTRRGIAALVPAAVTAWAVFALVWFMYSGMGTVLLPMATTMTALLMMTAAPLFESVKGNRRWALPIVAGVLTIACGLVATKLPAYSRSSPERVNIEFDQDAAAGTAQWLVVPESGALPKAMWRVAPFGQQPFTPFPWSDARAFSVQAAPQGLPAPTLTILEQTADDGKRHVHAWLQSLRGAPIATLMFPPSAKVESFVMQGKPVPALPEPVLHWTRGWQIYACRTMPPQGVEVSFTLSTAAPVEVLLRDQSPGLPPAGLTLQRARPITAMPSQDGDVTIFTNKVQLGP